MPLLRVITDAPGYAKVTLQGPQGSGKSRTSVEIATYIHKLFGSQKPIAFFDTESGSDYLVDLIKERSGTDPLRVKTRAFSDLLEVVKECLAGASDILLVDSITHVWRELNDGYMAAINKNLRYEKTRMDIGDIMQVKKLWEPWPNQFLNAPLHMIVCGREGNEWGSEENEKTGKRESVAIGKKMKVEGEFGYEASLMLSMSAIQTPEKVIKKKDGQKERQARAIINVATVLKDRFDVMNGEMFEMPSGEDFLPYLQRLRPELHKGVDTDTKSDGGIDASGDDGFGKEKRQRVIYCEEVQGEMLVRWPGQTADEKKAKSDCLERIFGTRSWSKVESLDSKVLRSGLDRLVAEREAEQVAAAIPA